MTEAYPAGWPPAMLPPPQRSSGLAVLTSKIEACTACTAQRPAGMRVVGDGPLDASIVLIGEAPGADEEAAGRPFVGASGKMLDDWLASAGILRKRVRVLNLLACRPTEPGARRDTLRNRTPTPVEARACRAHMLEQLGLLTPIVIVTIGGTSLHAFKPRGRIVEATAPHFNAYVKRDGTFEQRMAGMPALPAPAWIKLFSIWHPAGVMHLQRSSKAEAKAAVRASVARLDDARQYVERNMSARTGGDRG